MNDMQVIFFHLMFYLLYYDWKNQKQKLDHLFQKTF